MFYRRIFVRILAVIVALVFGVLVAAADVHAQPGTKTYRIGVLEQGNPPKDATPAADFRQGLRDWGYVENRTVALEFRYAGGNLAKLPALAAELARMNVDVIVTVGDPAAFAAKKATTSIPIVATEFGLDPVKAGLVASLGRPEANLTGLSSISEELWQKRLALLREILPRLTRIGVVLNPANQGNASCLAEIRSAAGAMGIRVQSLDISDERSIERVFAAIAKDTLDGLAVCWDSVTMEHAQAIADLALNRRLPLVAPLREYVSAGALLSFGMSLAAHRRQAAHYAHRIIKGAKPADLPVEQPKNFELVINVATAKALGLAVPPSLALLAEDLIQ